MSSQEFQSIIAGLQNRQISEADARQRLQRLKAATLPEGQLRSAGQPEPNLVDIAVIGMAGQFPAADCVEQFWYNLKNGVGGVAELGEHYLDIRRHYSPERQPGKTCCKWGGVLEQRDDFDSLFFNLSPRDAESMNPHQRLVLQEGWKALEDAGYNPKSLRAQPVGVFVGAEPAGYFHETFIGASDAIIASRLSYFLDFKGPALVVNTGCSSSAAAIHLACESLRRRESDLALAGGVFATLGEHSLISLSQMDMLSPSGRCHSFDQRGDGIVLSEAVAMVTLKRLPDALADGDPVRGVICASGMNQDGASNGITAPNGQAQERLICELYRRFEIDPRQISHVEAHGTGTPLGDPVEVNALIRAFRQFSTDTGYCALGSAKAHIGHTSAAAGVVSLIKILLSMQYRQLPGVLNFEQLNPRIALADSAFCIHRELRDWHGDGGAPLMAALNSFGHSGTNVHMVIRAPDEAAATPAAETPRPRVLPLSARTDDSLKRYVRQVRAALADPALRLADLTYTMQSGRPALERRVAFLCDSQDQLAQQLDDWLEGRAPRQGTGAGELQTLAEVWAAGGEVEWRREAGARRIHAPVYPFERRNCRVPRARRGAEDTARRLHPLLAQNTSDLQCQRFSTVFDGGEFFFSQHVVGGRRIFPGVGHLEMARAALALAAATRQPVFSDVVWLRPLIVDGQPRQVDVELRREDDNQIRFEIKSRDYDPLTGQAGGEPLLHSQGLARFAEVSAPPSVDLAALAGRMDRGTVSAEQCYQTYREMAFEYGPAFRGLKSVAVGQGEVLAELALPACRHDSLNDYGLHPSLMDSALQAAIALSPGGEAPRAALPFALEGLRIGGRCSERMWARVSLAGRRSVNGLQALNIELFDPQGKCCVLMEGLTSRAAEPAQNDAPAMETLLFQPQWADQALSPGEMAEFDQCLILLHGFDAQAVADLRLAGCRCETLAAPLPDPADDYQQAALALLRRIRAFTAPGGRRRLIQLVIHPDGERMTGGLVAMLRSLRLEAPDFSVQLIEVDTPVGLAQRLEDNRRAGDVEIRYRAGLRQVRHWRRCPALPTGGGMPWRDRGVYLITGGLGGLGQIFARAIAASARDTTLILTGRTALASALAIDQARVEYHSLDVSDRAATARLVEQILARHGGLNGVLHCAGVNRDSLLINKQDDELRQVLAAKVAGVRSLDLATARVPLDFMIMFSSATGVLGNPGQADYAAANAFVDRYAAYRSRLAGQGRRSGHSLSINWPLWQEGGMKVDAATAQRMLDSTGMRAMPSQAGVDALYQCVAQAQAQLLVMHGRREPLCALVTGGAAPVDHVPLASDGAEVRRALIELVSRQMKIPIEEIRPDAGFSQYGFDSISLTRLAASLKQQWGLKLAPTIFFEHATIERFAAYLEREHGNDLAPRVSIAPPASVRRRLTPESAPEQTAGHEEIAIIGVSGRFPMADDVEQFFRNLSEGRDCISEIPADRWDWREYYGDPHQQPGKTHIKWGGFINGVDYFDPLFFAISPREAQLMDPQQRLLMTYVWLALEDAGYASASLAGSDTGIFIGTGMTGYSSLIAQSGVPVEGYSATAMVPSVGPNRMSFLLDLHGPSEPVETACSSSLVAIHRAVRAMRSGECQMAIVGGVNTLIAPEAQISFNKAGMLAPDGRSKTFSAQANGYARGEGVGMIVLKQRSRAEADGDHIYALIRGTGVNHGGKAHSLTAPNPRAQADLLNATWRRAGVDPGSIGYIEAHGTGTALGDPVEINALKMAFGAQGPGTCGVGSVKSNIGHLELAAGVASVIKVLLQFKHQMLFKSLHCEEINPYIELDNSPFYIVRQNQPWPARNDLQGHALPRRAGVSSFGFGGANAHILLEEYQPAPIQEDPAIPGERVFLLSARTPERLREYARRLAAFIAAEPDEARQDPLRYLDRLAYTLQVGRDAMEERLAVLSDALPDLQRQLAEFAAGGTARYRGRNAGDSPTLALFQQDEDLSAALAAWVAKRKYPKLLALWVQGLNFDWRPFHLDAPPMQRLSLPGYPFAEERYWVTDLARARPPDGGWLHPLLERNTSDFGHQRFSSRWRGNERWFTDHKVDGDPAMPGVAYLEMARAALVQSLDERQRSTGGVRFKNIVWLKPYTPGPQQDELHIELEQNPECMDFRIYSRIGGEAVEHCKGSVEPNPAVSQPPLALDALRAEPWLDSLDASGLYARFDAIRIHYGPSHRGVDQLWLGEGRVLARLALNPDLFDDNWVLQPGMLDSALQASIGLLLPAREDLSQTLLPFALEQLSVSGPCQPVMWALIRLDPDNARGVRRVDIDLCDEQGRIAVSLRGLCSRPLNDGRVTPLPAGLSLLAPQWIIAKDAQASRPALPTLAIGAASERRDWLSAQHPRIHFLPALAHTIDAIAAQLAACPPFERLIWLAPQPVPEMGEPAVLVLFRLIKALLQLGYQRQPFELQLIVTASAGLPGDEPVVPQQAACHGLAGSLAREYPHWRVDLFDLPADRPPLPDALPAAALPGECLAWREGEWYRQRLVPLAPADDGVAKVRDGGVYVVIGGAGGIGAAWTRHMMRRHRARVVWLGRRSADAAINAQLAALAQECHAPAPLYIQADARDAGQLARARQQVLDAFGPIHGLVHSALVLDDARLEQLDEARFSAVLDAKMATSLNMARVFAPDDHPALEQVLFFSSMTAFSRAAGQSNYAAGCAFTDALAAQLAQHWPCAVKVINWGYWGSLGVVADPIVRARMARQGLGSIEPDEGMAALERLLASPLPQLGLIKLLRPMAIDGVDNDWQLACYPAHASLTPCIQTPPPLPPQHHSAAGEMDRLLLAQVFACLGELAGEGPLTGQRIAAHPAVAANLAAQPFYRSWLRASLRWLAQCGAIDDEGRVLTVVPDAATQWSQWRLACDAWRQDSDLRAELQLAETCVRALPAILRGEQPATGVIFPGGAMTLVEDIYKNNRVADYFNDVLAQVAADVARRYGEDQRPLRILEIGAGTGGATAGLIHRLGPWQDQIDEYRYTDVSQAFLRHAERHFAPEAPYLRTSIFDVSRRCDEQDIDINHYDLVIAANVLHATPDLRFALQNVKATLRHGGLLLLNEISDRSLFTHLTFGLLEGWWRHDDAALRIADCPGLYPERWRRLLRSQGFIDIAFPAVDSHHLGQQIIVAASDGVACLPTTVSGTSPVTPAIPAPPVIPAKAGNHMPLRPPRLEPPAPASAGEADEDRVAASCRQLIIDAVSKLVNMAPERLRRDTALDRYGIDSILQISLIQTLERVTGALSRTLLFEYNTINQLADYLLSAHRPALARHFAPPAAPPGADERAAHTPVASVSALGHDADRRDIAIIGVGGRYPMAADLDRFWDNLQSGRNCVSETPAQRWSCARDYGGFLEQIDAFDATLFGISASEADMLSPALRQMLEVTWLTLENAGYNRDAIARLQAREAAGVGVFIGSMYPPSPMNGPTAEQAAIRFNVTDWQIPNRISHCFDLRGPSLAVNSACSSSMTALHLACQSLLQHDCAMALAGGVNLILDPSRFQTLKRAGYLGSGDQSRGLGQGDGMIPGEGAGAVLLKPLAMALADGDRIHGVIKSSCVNHGGGRLMFSAPDTQQQSRLMAGTIRRAGLLPGQISYVEAAANGSELGDPIEVAALKKVFCGLPPASCALGTVKSNIGHLEAASGISQLTKVLLQLRHRQLAPSIHAEPLNPHIHFDGSAFYLPPQASPWPAPRGAEGECPPRRCLINSFGAGGSYASLVVEEFRATRPLRRHPPAEQLLIVAAASRHSLLAWLEKLQAWMVVHPDLDLAALAYSLARREHRLAQRAALVAEDPPQALARLRVLLTGHPPADGGCWLSPSDGVEEGETAIASGTLAQIAAAWCQGAGLDTLMLYPAGGDRIDLPDYAFEHAASPPAFNRTHYQRIVSGELNAEQFEQMIMADMG